MSVLVLEVVDLVLVLLRLLVILWLILVMLRRRLVVVVALLLLLLLMHRVLLQWRLAVGVECLPLRHRVSICHRIDRPRTLHSLCPIAPGPERHIDRW